MTTATPGGLLGAADLMTSYGEPSAPALFIGLALCIGLALFNGQ